MNLTGKIIDVVKCRCPECTKGKIFKTKGTIFLFKVPEMHKRCPTCNFKFEKETGFFFGAMFVSYGLAVAEMIGSLIIFWMFLDLSPLHVFFVITTIALFVSSFNFRVSRAIWIYLFYKN